MSRQNGGPAVLHSLNARLQREDEAEKGYDFQAPDFAELHGAVHLPVGGFCSLIVMRSNHTAPQ